MIPRLAAQSPSLSPADKLVLAVIVSLHMSDPAEAVAGVEPSQPYIAWVTGVSLPTVKRAIATLVDAKLIKSVRRGLQETNLYWISDEGVEALRADYKSWPSKRLVENKS